MTVNQEFFFCFLLYFVNTSHVSYLEVTLAKKGGPARQLLYSSLPYTYIPEVGTTLLYHGIALEASHV